MSKLPPGIENNTLEVYRYKGKTKAMLNGEKMDYLELPSVLREPFQAELISDLKARECLVNSMRITDPDLMEEKFASCRYGAYDGVPDLKDGKLTADAPLCELIDDCKGFNVICKIPEGPNGQLTRKQYQVTQLVAAGKLDKEIAYMLGMKVTTVRTHLSRIRETLCVNNRIEIAFWAKDKGIV
jgi:DNA-binding CsgD family transcriptional regulator